MIHVLAIVGPTASGKTALGMSVARSEGGEIVSVDSRQAYRGIDIGTGKPTAAERSEVPHHLIDILDLPEKNDAESYAARANAAIREIASRGRLPLLVGGSGLYFRAITQGLFRIDLEAAERRAFEASLSSVSIRELGERLAAVDPASARRIHPNDRYRITRALEVHALTGTPLSAHFERQGAGRAPTDIRFITVGLEEPRRELHRKIEERVGRMLAGGWTEEVRSLLEGGADPGWPGLRTLGYPQVIALARGEAGRSETKERVVELTRQYAKRQITWFRKEPGIRWLRGTRNEAAAQILRLLEAERP